MICGLPSRAKGHWRNLQRTLDIRSSPSKSYEAIRHDSPGFTRERYSLHKPVRLLRNGEQGYVKCPHERGWPLAFANCVMVRIRGNAWKWAGVVGDSPWLIRELEDESSPSAIKTGPFTGPFFVEEERVERTHVRQNAVSVLGRAASPHDPPAIRPRTKTGQSLFSPIPPSPP